MAGPDFNSPALTNAFTETEKSELKENPLPMPSVTEFYYRWFAIGFVLPVFSAITGICLLRTPECPATALTWFVCLSLVSMLMWSAYTYIAVHVGFMAYTYYL